MEGITNFRRGRSCSPILSRRLPQTSDTGFDCMWNSCEATLTHLPMLEYSKASLVQHTLWPENEQCVCVCVPVQLAGYNRLLLALRANTVPHIHTLLLSQTGLPAAAVGLLEACVDAGGMGGLRQLDLLSTLLGDKRPPVVSSCHRFL